MAYNFNTKSVGRQELIIAHTSVVLADLTSGTALPIIKLPANAVIYDVVLRVTTAFNSGTTDALVIQSNEGTPKAYVTVSAGAGALSAGLTARAATGASTNLAFVNTSTSTIDFKWTGAGTAATTGAANVTVAYYVDKRQEFTQD